MINNNINEQLNHFHIINYTKFKYIIKNLLFFLFMFIMLLFISFQIYIYNKEIIPPRAEKFDNIFSELIKTIFNYKRILNLTNNINDTNINTSIINNNEYINNTQRNKNIIITHKNNIEEIIKEKFNADYAFILNLSSNYYIGNWSELYLKGNDFFNNKINKVL